MPITLNGDTGIQTPMYNGTITANAVTPSVNMKNRLINSAMVIDQRNAGASVTQGTANTYTLDRWVCAGAVASKFTVQQSSTAPAGFTNSALLTSSSAYSITSGDYYYFMQGIEGFNVADLGWGTANAKTITLSFWVRSSLTGTFGGALRNSIDGATRSYPFTFTISSANTYEYKTITVAGDTSGTWTTNNTCSLTVCFSMGTGSTFSGTAGAWAGSNLISATGATSVVGTSGATFYITGVQLEVGSTATSFDYRPYGTELALCQRYYWQLPPSTTYSAGMPMVSAGQAYNSTNAANFTVTLPVTMRASPTLFQSGLRLYAPNIGDKAATIALGTSNTIYGTVVNASGATGLVGGNMWYVTGSGNATDYIGFGAEL